MTTDGENVDTFMEDEYRRMAHYRFGESDANNPSESGEKKLPLSLCLLGVPRELTTNGIRNMCRTRGAISNIRRKGDLAFVDFESFG